VAFNVGSKQISVSHWIKKKADTITAISVAAAPTAAPSSPKPTGGTSPTASMNGAMNCKCKFPMDFTMAPITAGRRKRSAPLDRIFGGGNNLLGGSIMDMLMDEITNNPEVMSSLMTQMVESGAMEEMMQEMVSSGMMEDMVKEMIASGAAEQLIQELVASGAVEEAVQEAIDSGAHEQIVQQLIESGAIEQTLQEVVESGALEEALQEFMTNGQLEEVLEGIDTEALLQEFMEENNGLFSEEEFEAYIQELLSDVDPEMMKEIMAMFAEMELEMECNCEPSNQQING